MRIERDCPFKLAHRFLGTAAELECESLGGMGFGQRVVQRERLRTRLENDLQRDVTDGLLKKERIAIRDAGVSTRVKRVELDRLAKHLARELVIGLRPATEKFAPAQIIRVSLDTLG